MYAQAVPSQVELLCTEILGLQESLASKESSSRSVNALEHMVGQLKGELEITQAELQDMVRESCAITYIGCNSLIEG